jgi:hypothetical protein
MSPDDTAELVQDRDHDGVVDYLNARIVVPDDPSPAELAAASNVAARLAFEVLSLDLPLAYRASEISPADSRIPIFIGRTQVPDLSGLILPTPEDAIRFARDYRRALYVSGSLENCASDAVEDLSVQNCLEQGSTLVLSETLNSIEVIDLAARIGLESTHLKLPIATTDIAQVSAGSILIGNFDRLRSAYEQPLPLRPGVGRLERVVDRQVGTVISIAGGDEEGLAEAIRYAAERLPYVGNYGELQDGLEVVARNLRRTLCQTDVANESLIFEKTAALPWEVDDALKIFEEKFIPLVRSGSQVRVEFRLSEPSYVRATLARHITARLLECGVSPSQLQVTVLSAYKQGYSWITESLVNALKGARHIRIGFRPLGADERSADSSIRWLQELYPVDEVLARQLGIERDRITFEQLPEDSPHIYEVIAEDGTGESSTVGTFDPRHATRTLFDRFPEYGHAVVTTGGFRGFLDGNQVVDERIKSDPEQFWDWYQKEVLEALADHLTEIYGGRIDPACAPHFGSLEIDLELSEPDYRIGVDEERISTIEALHEDIYFETLLFLDVLGQQSCGQRLAFPGRIIPRVRASTENDRGRVRARLTGKRRPGKPRVEIKTPEIEAIEVEHGHAGLASVVLRVAANSCDVLPMPATTHRDIRNLTLQFDDQVVAVQGGTAAKAEPAVSPAPVNGPLVQWDTPIGPDECGRIVKRLGEYPEIRCYPAGVSYLGRTIWAMDVKTPAVGRYFSKAKASIQKAAILITGRQHANEVSSTSHILRLAELLATDDEARKLLKKAIFILHPMTNPDGSHLIEELRHMSPGHMLHACYLGALGADVTERFPETSPIYPEAEVRPYLIQAWKPFLVLNPHGYPSHEWVQLFAGYSAWFRSRQVIARDWWIPRGWFIPRLEYTAEQEAWVLPLLDVWSEALEPVVGELNQRMRNRYAKYGAFDQSTYRMTLHRNLLVNARLKNNAQENEPLEIVTEVPDEVAQGSWLRLLAQAGLECSLATARCLSACLPAPERLCLESADALHYRVRRRLPEAHHG